MQILPSEFRTQLDSFDPHISNYSWMWKILRRRARVTGWFPRRLHSAIRRFGNPRKPYFVGNTCDGIRFLGDYRDEYAATCEVCPEYDASLIRFMQERLRNRDGDYIDVGCNLGVTASAMARFLKGKGNVLAFEPVSDTAQRAAATFALNNLDNVRLFQMAVGDMDEEISLFAVPGNSEWASVYKTDQEQSLNWTATKVQCSRLDTLMLDGSVGKVGLIKVDVEGHEPKVVIGASQLLARERPEFIFEYNSSVAPKVGWTPEVIEKHLTSVADYHCQVIHSDNSLAEFPFPIGAQGVFNILASCSRGVERA